MRIKYIILLFFIGISSLIIQHWYKNKNSWKNSTVKKNIIEWNGSSMVVLLKNKNYYTIKVFDIYNKKFVHLDDFNMEYIFLDAINIEKYIHTLENKNSVVYIINTKIPIKTLHSFLQEKDIEIKTPFICFNQQENKVMIHGYFFNKCKECKDFIMLDIIDLNEIINNNQLIPHDTNNKFFLGFNDMENINNLLDQYEKSFKDVN